MKTEGIILFVFFCIVSISSASVEVHGYDFQTFYYPYEGISGEINLTISNENYLLGLHDGNNEEIPIGDFLNNNGVDYQCSPPDCSNDYSFSSASKDKTYTLNTGQTTYGGFVLTGTEIVLTNLDFSIESNFGINNRNPISINFFEDSTWKFNAFSDIFSSKIWGCYEAEIPSQGPLIGTSSYCEMIFISETGALNIGAYVDSGDNKVLNMELYPEYGGSYLGRCSYNPQDNDGCQVDAESGEIFEGGQYQVCVSADTLTNYHIYEESSGTNCGFVYSIGPGSSTKDYAIFAQTVKYANADLFSSTNIDLTETASMADNLIETRYNRNCSTGCILPLAFNGIPQSLRIYNISLQYTRNGENYLEENIYNLESIPATIDFSGTLDLSLTNFNISQSGSYALYLGDTKLFEEDIEKIPAPIINSLSPINPPAGVPVEYYVNVDYDVPNSSLTYKWKFGNKSYTTTTNLAVHTFIELKNHTVTIEVSAGENLTSEKSFIIKAISPAEAVNTTLSKKRESLDNVIQKINTLPSWYQEILGKRIDISSYESELNRLEKAQTDTIEDAEFVTIAKDLYSLNVPSEVFIDDDNYPFLWTKLEDINLEKITKIIGGSNYKNLEDYKNPILNWQTQNIKGSFSTKLFSVSKWNGGVTPILRTYKFNIASLSNEESYFVINRPREEIYFNKLSDAEGSEGTTVITLNKNKEKNFEFYYESSEETTFFISPKLNVIILEENIDTTCNFNNFCEKDLGENSETCRSDCKPINMAIGYIALAMAFALFIYTILQIWYKRNYENHLFGNRRELYNLLMYIANARARSQTDKIIVDTLKKQKWSSERITYAIKKSHGQVTGLFEIIPLSKITANFRNSKARKKIATPIQQQNERNINKSRFQKRL